MVVRKESHVDELSVRVKAVPRTAGGVKVYVTKSRSVPVKIGKGLVVKKRADQLKRMVAEGPNVRVAAEKR